MAATPGADGGSTVPRRQLGRYLKQYRESAGMTLAAASRELDCSPQKLWRIETGRQPTKSPDVRALCDIYGVNGDLKDALIALARETNARGWWHAYGEAVPDWFEVYVGLESAASRIRRYHTELVPGLLQTREYALALHGNWPDATAESAEQAAAVRLERQALLTRKPTPPRYDVILGEAALRRHIAGAGNMAEQLRHLIDVTRLPNVRIQVLPFSAGLTVGSEVGDFAVLDFEAINGDAEPTTVYQEGPTGALYLDKPDEVAVYEQVWTELTRASLDREQSGKMIAKIIGEMP